MCLVKELGKYIVNKCLDQGIDIDLSKLQKLLYFAQKKCLIEDGEPMFASDFLAWNCGPGLKEVFLALKEGLPKFTSKYDNTIMPLSRHVEIIDDVILAYGPKTTKELVDISKQEQPWIDAYGDGSSDRNVISKQSIQKSGENNNGQSENQKSFKSA